MLAVTAFFENFESGTFNASKWSNGVVGTPVVLREGTSGGPINSPNGIYALNLDGYSSSRGEAINSKTLDLTGYKSATLSYRVQAGGNGDDPDANDPGPSPVDNLYVSYKRSPSSAAYVFPRHNIANTSDTGFEARSFTLPSSALTSTFYFGFSARESDYSSIFGPQDDWYIDDVKVSGVPKTPDISINDRTVSEGNSTSFTIRLSEKTAGSVSVRYATSSNTAGSSDYVHKTGTVTFSPGQTSKTVSIATREDSIDELSERFYVNLSNASGGIIRDSRGIGTITDDDPTPQIRIASAGQSLGTTGSVDEGETASYTVSLDRPSSRNVTVAYATNTGTAIVDDFSGTSGTLTFSPGQTSKTVTVATLEDNIFEGVESFSMTLSNPSSTAVLSSSYRTSTFSIDDDDPVPSISIAPSARVEGDDDGSSPLSFDVTLSNPSAKSISINYATTDDTATAGDDYVSRSGTLTFAPLATSQSFTVALIGDDLDEGLSEALLVNLSNPSNATIGIGQAVGTITDDDVTPIPVAITGGAVEYVVSEGNGLSVSAADTTDADSSKLLYRWDFNNDGEFDIVSNSTDAEMSATGLAALGLDNGLLRTPIRLEVTDGTNTNDTTVDLVIINVAPDFEVGDDILLPPEASGILRRSLNFTDPTTSDQHIVSVDYGDGTLPVVTPLPIGARTFALDHQYQMAGDFNIRISVNDGDDTTTRSLMSFVTVGSSLPEVSFTGADALVSESDGSVTVSASLALPSESTVVVPLLFSGSAIRGGDYLPTSAFLEFSPGETTASVSLQLVNDTIFEPHETVDILMGIPTGARLGADTVRQTTITSDDSAPRIEFSSAFQIVNEGDSANVTVKLSSASAEDVIVPLQFFGSATGTANNYQFPGSRIIIPAGSTSASKSLLITDDTEAESAQVLLIGMGTPVGAIPAAAPATTVQTFIIPANDTPIVDLRAAMVQVDEDHGTLAVLIDLSNPINTTVSLPYTLSGTATDGDDFTLAPDTPLTFAAGQTSAAIDLTVIDDLLAEPFDLETVVISFGQPDVGVLGNTRSFELAIADNDVQRIDFTIDQQMVWEDDGTVTLQIESTRVADSDITIPITIIPGSARLADLDAAIPTEVVLLAGQTSATFSVPLLDDDRREGTESFVVQLEEPIGAVIGGIAAHRVSIRDDDPLVYLTVEQNAVLESGRGVNFQFRLSSPSNENVTVDFKRFGTAKYGSDYTLSHVQSVVIPAGESTGTVTATLKEDAQVERDESIGLRITGITGTNAESVGRKASFVVRNDDVSYAYFSSRPANVSEGQAFDVTVRMTEVLTTDVTFLVSRNTLGNSAQPNVDYTVSGLEQRKFLRIPAGKTAASFTINVNDDPFIEGSEVIELKLSKPSSSDARVDSINTLRYVVNASDIPTKKIILRAPRGFGLDEVDLPPGVILVSDGASAEELGAATIVDVGLNGDFIELPASEVASALGALAVDAGDASSGGKSTVSRRITGTVEQAPLTLNILSGGVLEPLEFDATSLQTLGLGGAPIPSSKLANECPECPIGTLAVSFGNGNSNFFGSTLFFDANFNGVPDFVDLNGDGIQQSNEVIEPVATTALDGTAQLAIPFAMDINADGVLDAQDGKFVLVGGLDTATELPLTLRMESAIGHFNVSPLSTIAAKLVHQLGIPPTDAEARTLAAFQVEGASFARTNIVAAAANGDTAAARVAMANAKVQSTAMAVSSLIGGIPGSPAIDVLGELVFLDMADKIRDPQSLLDLTSATVMDSIIRGVAFQTGLTLTDSAIEMAVTTITAANAEVDAIDVTGSDVLAQRAKVEIVAIGQLAPALAEFSEGDTNAADVLDEFTGTKLQQRIAAASPGIITPPRVAITSFTTLEGDGSGLLRYEVRIAGDVTRPVTVQYESVSGEAIDGEFTPVSGTLTWQPGETETRVIEVAYTGDVQFEGDEAVLVGLTSVTNAVLANDLGAGYMLNDDAFAFTADDAGAENDLRLVIDGADATFDQNDENVFAGTFSAGTTSSVKGAVGVKDVLSVVFRSDSVFLNGGLTYTGQIDEDDALLIVNGDADIVTQRITGLGEGTVNIDGRELSYSGVASVSDALLPKITGLPDQLQEASEIALGSVIPDTDDPATIEYSWVLTFNGQQIDSGAGDSFAHTFADDGGYEIALTLSGTGRATSTQIIEFSVANVAPTASIVSISDVHLEGTQIDVVTAATDPAADNDTLTFSYHVFKDSQPFATATGVDLTNFSFTPDDNGSYEIELVVNDEDGGSETTRQTVQVANVAPSLNVVGEQSIPESVLLTLTDLGAITDEGFDSPHSDSIETFTYSIDWGDGAVPNVANASIDQIGNPNTPTAASFEGSHVYADDGEYTVTVRIADDDMSGDFIGGTVDVDFVEQTFQVNVTNLDPTANDDTGSVDENGAAITIDVLNNDTDPAGTSDPRTVTDVNTTGTFGDVSFTLASVVYDPNGQFEYLAIYETATDTFAYSISDGDGGTDTATATITVTGTNDQPTITVVDVVGAVTEDDASVLTDVGSVTYAEIDETDVLTATVAKSAEVSSSAAAMPPSLSSALDSAVTLTQSGTNDGTIVWDFALDNGLVQYLAVGETVTATYTITLDDNTGTVNATTTQDVTVVITGTNDQPAITALNSSNDSLTTKGVVDVPITVDGNFFDVDISDSHVVTVDWGEVAGSSDSETISVTEVELTQVGSFVGSHAYSNGGIYTITVTIDDGNGGVMTQATTAVVTGVGVVDGTLYIIGTDGRDHVQLKFNNKKDELKVDVKLNQGGSDAGSDGGSDGGKDKKKRGKGGSDGGSDGGYDRFKRVLPASTVERVVAYLGDGDDRYDGGSDGGSDGGTDGGRDAPISQFIFGGAGDDHIKGGGGNDVLNGGSGKDHLEGGNGRDILLGGTGKDKLKGGRGDDLLVGDSAANEHDLTSLHAALANWSGTASDRLDAALVDIGLLTDDGDKDDLKGEKGDDELFGSGKDKLK